MTYVTRLASLDDYDKGGVEVIDDDPKNYAFSNIFEVASRAKPFEQIAVGKNFEYVLEVVRVEGVSGWRACAHDQSALVLEGEVEFTLRTLDGSQNLPPNGSVGIAEEVTATGMGRVVARRRTTEVRCVSTTSESMSPARSKAHRTRSVRNRSGRDSWSSARC